MNHDNGCLLLVVYTFILFSDKVWISRDNGFIYLENAKDKEHSINKQIKEITQIVHIYQ